MSALDNLRDAVAAGNEGIVVQAADAYLAERGRITHAHNRLRTRVSSQANQLQILAEMLRDRAGSSHGPLDPIWTAERLEKAVVALTSEEPVP